MVAVVTVVPMMPVMSMVHVVDSSLEHDLGLRRNLVLEQHITGRSHRLEESEDFSLR